MTPTPVLPSLPEPALRAALRLFIGAAYPVDISIDPRGHKWSEAYLDQALTTALGAIESLSRAPAEPAETEAWLIRMSDGTRFIHSHNAIGDYRSLDPGAKVVELVPRGSGSHPTESAGPAPAEIVRPNEWETVLAAQRLYAPMVAAVIDLLAAVDERHDTETGFKRYSVPYGAINNLRAVVGAIPSAPSVALGESHEG